MQNRKRNCNTLQGNARELRYKKETLKNCYLDGSLALRHPTSSQIKVKRQQGFHLNTPISNLNNFGSVDVPDGVKSSPGFYAARRDAIIFFYLLFGSPSKDELLNDDEIVSEICRRLLIPSNSKRCVLKVLTDIIEKGGNEYISKRTIKLASSIEDHDEEVELISDYMGKGLGLTQTTFLVNINREKNGKSPVARSTVESFVNRSKLFVRTLRETLVSSYKLLIYFILFYFISF